MRPHRAPRAALLSACLVLAARAAAAHDFWIEPGTYRPAPGERFAVRLRVGDLFPGEPVPRLPAHIERFALLAGAGESEVIGLPNRDPAGYAVADRPGLQLLVYDSDQVTITLAADRFERHLGEEGLERVSALRRERGESQAPATELFSRCAKALVAVPGADGAASAAGYDRRVGLPLELVPEADPYALAGGGRLPLLLLYEGRPVEGVLVGARRKDRPGEIAGRTGADGRIVLDLPAGGFWLIHAVHMVEAPAGSGADWESFWASLTFELPPQPEQKSLSGL